MPALATWAPEDGILGLVAPLGLAASRPVALVVDLGSGLRFGGDQTLRRLVEERPRRADLIPPPRGLAVLPSGGARPDEAADILDALVRRWPFVVFRVDGPQDAPSGVPLVALRPVLPRGMLSPVAVPVVWQSTGLTRRPGDGRPVLPRAGAAVVRTLLGGMRPRRDRWVRSLGRLWGMSWG